METKFRNNKKYVLAGNCVLIYVAGLFGRLHYAKTKFFRTRKVCIAYFETL